VYKSSVYILQLVCRLSFKILRNSIKTLRIKNKDCDEEFERKGVEKTIEKDRKDKNDRN